MFLLFTIYLLIEVIYLLTEFNKSKFFPWNTTKIDRNGVNKLNTHMHAKHSEKDNGEGEYENMWYSPFFKTPSLHKSRKWRLGQAMKSPL